LLKPSKTETSVTLETITASTGQAVEYAINTTNAEPSSGWQDSPTFTGLTGWTTYYFFARAKADNRYNEGAVSGGREIRTGEVSVSWSNLMANGSANTQDTDILTLIFDKDPTTLTAADITITGATKGTLSGSGNTRTLAISGITVAQDA